MISRMSCCLVLVVSAAVAGAPVRVAAQTTGGTSTASRVAEDSLLMHRERAQWEALKARDTSTFARLMGGNLIDVDVTGARRTSPQSVIRYVLACGVTSYALNDVHVTHFDSTAVVTYKTALEAVCWGQKAPSPLYVMTVYQRRGGGWQPIAHSETPASRE